MASAKTMSSVKTTAQSQTNSRRNSKRPVEQTGGVTLDRQVSATAIPNSGLGSRKMTLYLSRTKSMVKPGNVTQNKHEEREIEKSDSLMNGEMPPANLQREFTFTGYDIMADSK